MVKKAFDRARQVDRHELMNDPFGKPVVEQARRRHRAGSCQNGDPGPLLDEALHQRQYRGCLADARGMDPHQRTGRPPGTGDAEALADAGAVFLAALLPALQVKHHGGR